MAVTTKVKYQTSDNKYYETEKEATISQSLINKTNLMPWREKQYDSWIEENSGSHPEHTKLMELLNSGATDGKEIQSIVCDAIVSKIKGLYELSSILSHTKMGLKR